MIMLGRQSDRIAPSDGRLQKFASASRSRTILNGGAWNDRAVAQILIDGTEPTVEAVAR